MSVQHAQCFVYNSVRQGLGNLNYMRRASGTMGGGPPFVLLTVETASASRSGSLASQPDLRLEAVPDFTLAPVVDDIWDIDQPDRGVSTSPILYMSYFGCAATRQRKGNVHAGKAESIRTHTNLAKVGREPTNPMLALPFPPTAGILTQHTYDIAILNAELICAGGSISSNCQHQQRLRI